MPTLYLRNVPADVVDRLRRLASETNSSVSAVAVHELDRSTRRVDNAALLARLPDLDISVADVLDAIDAGRDEP